MKQQQVSDWYFHSFFSLNGIIKKNEMLFDPYDILLLKYTKDIEQSLVAETITSEFLLRKRTLCNLAKDNKRQLTFLLNRLLIEIDLLGFADSNVSW